MSEERVLSDFVWTPERGEHDPEVRSISWNNLLLSDEVNGGKFLTASEIRINPDTALQSTVFLACCRIISETVASLPLHVYRRLKNGHEEIAHDIPLYHVLSFAPNSWQTKFEFFEQMVMALTCWGNSYSEVNSGKYGAVTELNNLHPSRMRIERLENGRLKYSYNDPQTGRLMQYTQDQIMHVRWTPEPDGVKGMVPVEISRDAIALSRACEIYASKFWANMGRPGIVLQTDGALSAETAERLRDNWERIHRGVQNAYKTAVLTNGLKVEPFGATNNDSQFLEVRRFQCEEIARVFRLSLGLIQGTSTGGNLEVQGQEFINYTLMPWLTRIEQSISRSLIYDDATYYAKFDTRGLLRGDSNSRAAYYSTMLNLGILSINECRRAEGLGPLGPEADKHLVAMNLQPLEEAVKPKPDPSMMPGFGSGAPPKAPGVPPSLSEVKTGKAPMESPKGEDSAKRAEVRTAAEDLQKGDFVSWGSSGGRARGRVVRVVKGGSVNVPDSDFTIEGTEDDPAALIAVYEEVSGGWRQTKTRVGHKVSTLTKIKPLESANDEESRELLPQDEKLEEAHTEIAEEEGKWTKGSAHYIEKNPFSARGIKCHNCTHYVEEGGCEIVSGSIDGDAICKLWVIPPEKIAEGPEQRAYCATGEGNGIDNSCSSGGGGSKSIPAGDESLVKQKPFVTIGDTKNSSFAGPPNEDEVKQAINAKQREKFGAQRDLPEGTPVDLRIDINAFKNHKVYAVTAHEHESGTGVGTPIGYDTHIRLKGAVQFTANENSAEAIAKGKAKGTHSTVKGKFDPSREIPPDIDSWTPVGYDPQKAAYYYDKRTGDEVLSGTDALSVGNTVFTREPKYGKRNAKKHYRSLEEMMAVDSWGLESRAFCPTGEGNGIDNSCGSGDGGSDSDSSGPGDVPRGDGGPKDKGPQPISDKGPRPISGKDVLKLLEKIAQNPDGFTLDPANAEQPETGIMVSEFANDSRRSVKIKASDIKTAAGQQAFIDWFDNNADLLAGDLSRFIGGWKTGDDFYIDVATRFDPDKADQALEAGRKSGQLAVFNLGTFKETWVKYDDGDKRKPKEWDSGFARARKDAASKQVYDESSPAMQDEDWAGELSEHGKKTVRNYTEEPEEAVAHDTDSAIRRSEQADTNRNVSSVPGIPGEVVRGEGREARSGLVRGLSGGEAGTLQGSAGASEVLDREGSRRSVESRDDCGRTPDGKFGPKNECQEDGDGSSATDTKGRKPAKAGQKSAPAGERYVDVFSRAASSRATVRSEDGKKIERTSIPGASVSTAIGGIDEVDPLSIARYLDSQQAEVRGTSINTSKELSAEDRDYMVTSLVMQVESAMERGVRPAFYSEEDRAKQVEEYAKIQPMMRGGRTASGLCIDGEDENGDCKPSEGVSPNAEFLFRATQALTSIGATPYQNMRMTDEALTGFFENPDPDARLGSDANLSGASERIVRNSLNRLHGIIDRVGLDAAREMFMGPEIPVEELQSYFSSRIPGSGDETFDSKAFLRGEMSPPFAIFGPKVGPFFANNNGNLDPLTADLWFTRTWTRLSGELVKEMRPELAMKHGEALLGITGNIPRPELAALGVNGTAFRKAVNEMKKTGTIPATIRDWAQVRVKQYQKDGFPNPKKGTGTQKRYELDRLATNIMDNVASSAEAPQNGSQRANMVSVMKEVSTRTGVPVAYLQDILWQDEQDAWGTLGSRTSTQPGVPSLFSDVIKDVAASRVRRGQNKRSYEEDRRPEILPYDEKGGVEQLLWDEANFEMDTEQFVDLALALFGRGEESRAFCATGEGNGIDNSCGSDGKPATGDDKSPKSGPTSSTVKIGDKQEEIDSRLGKMGVNMGDAMAMASAGADGVYTFIRRDQEKPSEGGLHIETTRDVAGVKDGMFSQTVIRNVGSESDPEIVVDHKLMEVKPEVAADPEKRHAAARSFYRGMTESVEAAVKAGASKVVMNAAGNPKGGSFKGYTIWPRMGFDAPIPFDTRKKLPESLGHCRTLLDLHATKEGTRWWRDNGTDIDVQLDLKRADSPQMQVFGRFVRHFERDKRELAYGPGEGWLSPADQAKLDELWEQIWDDGLLDDYTGDDENFSQVEEKRAFCPTGEGNGTDNSCSSGQGSLDNSWKKSEESVQVWEGKDLEDRPPIKGGGKLKSFAIESPVEMNTTLKAMGVSLTDAVTMCASPSEGTTVIVSPEHPYDSMGLANFSEESEGLVHTMTTKDIAGIPNAMDSNASLRKTKEGELILEYHGFHASPEAQEKAAVACAKEVIGGVVKSVSIAEKSGVSEIRLDAAGDKKHPSFQGYRIWPKFGFDGVIPRKMLTRLREQDLSPRALAEKRAGKLTIQALYETKAGQQYWEERGGEIPMTLRPGDESTPGWARFKAYRERVGKLAEKRDFSAGNEIFSEEELQKLDELWSDFRKEAAEKRAFCPTGEGNGVDNSCGSGGTQAMMAPDKDSGGGWGGETRPWGKSSETEVYMPDRPLFGGAERFAAIKIYRPNDVKGQIEDGLKMTVADAILAAGPISDSVDRSSITKPRLEIVPTGAGIEMHWTAMGVATGAGYSDEEKQFAPRPGTVVKAAEASRDIWVTKSGPVLHMGGFYINPDFQGRGIGLDSVRHSTSAPVVRLEMEADRFDHPNPNTRMTGYKVWPKYGYDAPISAVRAALLSGSIPDFLSKAKTISDVYAIPGGREWWAENGGPIKLVFDRSPRSRSWQTMLKYADRPRSNRSMTTQEKIGRDSDADETVDAFWSRVQSGEETLSGEVITHDEYDRWIAESKEAAKDGNAGEVQPH